MPFALPHCPPPTPRGAAFWLIVYWHLFYVLEYRGFLSYLNVFGKERVYAILYLSSALSPLRI